MEVGSGWREGLVLGILSAALPFTLVAWGFLVVEPERLRLARNVA